MVDKYTGASVHVQLEPQQSVRKHWSLKRTSGWYDFLVTVNGDPGFSCHIAGHVETGADSISDPAMGGLV